MKIRGVNVCIGCMHTMDKEEECPYCNLNIKEYKQLPHCLLPGTKLAKRYILGKVLGEGSSGITYLAWDFVLEIPVAIKEFYPLDIVKRDLIRGTDPKVYIQGKEEYKEKLDNFIRGAVYLSRFNGEEGIAAVRDFFSANQTAYLVMEYVDGESVREVVQKKGKMNGKKVLTLMKPVLKSLAKVHQMGLLYLDMSPDNLVLNKTGKLVMVDFGTARRYDISGKESVSPLFKKGFSPEEQYRSNGHQGKWSDIYAVCATMYYMMTGKEPIDVVERIAGKTLTSLEEMPDIELSSKKKATIMKGLSIRAENRYQNMEQLMEALYYKELVINEDKKGRTRRKWLPVVGIAALFFSIFAVSNWDKECQE